MLFILFHDADETNLLKQSVEAAEQKNFVTGNAITKAVSQQVISSGKTEVANQCNTHLHIFVVFIDHLDLPKILLEVISKSDGELFLWKGTNSVISKQNKKGLFSELHHVVGGQSMSMSMQSYFQYKNANQCGSNSISIKLYGSMLCKFFHEGKSKLPRTPIGDANFANIIKFFEDSKGWKKNSVHFSESIVCTRFYGKVIITLLQMKQVYFLSRIYQNIEKLYDGLQKPLLHVRHKVTHLKLFITKSKEFDELLCQHQNVNFMKIPSHTLNFERPFAKYCELSSVLPSWKKEVFVHKASPWEAVKDALSSFLLHHDHCFVKLASYIHCKNAIIDAFKQCCSESFKFLSNEDFKQTSLNTTFAAYYLACYASLAEMEKVVKFYEYKTAVNEMILLACWLLNIQHSSYLQVFHDNLPSWVDTKRQMLLDFIKASCRATENISQNEILFLVTATLELGNQSLQTNLWKSAVGFVLLLPLLARTNFQKQALPNNLDSEGNIYDRARDPPGQRSVYIPPGDPVKETYRLSTFIKFPPDSPVNPRRLAAVGFFFTGYKDRVKCFSCGLCVENWTYGDDVSEARWHRSDCLMMLRQESGNIPIGSGLFTHFRETSRASPHLATESSGVSSLPSSNVPPTSATNIQQTVVPTTPAGMLLRNADRSSNIFQTARPVGQPQQIHHTLLHIELATITSVHHEQLIRSLDLRKEADRVRTYSTWPQEFEAVHPTALAQSGFFYLGNLDRVQCFSCGGVLRNWSYGDNVHAEHRSHFPECRMARGIDNRNVALPASERVPIPRRVLEEPPDPTEAQQRELLNMFPCLYPVNPHMRNQQVRLETFDHRWPANQVRASPQQISNAGFFFLGERDRVKCWYCNGGLQNWDPEDEPWTEHAKWFPTCEFLLQRKGPNFVHRMVALFPNLRRPILRGPFDVPPGHRGLSGMGRSRQPSPPPPIIDPKVEMQRLQAHLTEAMKSSLVTTALQMGFQRPLIQRVVKRKLERDSSMYTSVSDLVDDLTSASHEEPSDEDENMSEGEESSSLNQQPTDVKIPASTEQNVPSGGATPGTSAPVLSSGGSTAAAAGGETVMETSSISSLPEGTTPSMEARIRELQDERKCKICLDKIADVVFVPCGHLCSCTSCAPPLRRCPICRKKIQKSIRTYMS